MVTNKGCKAGQTKTNVLLWRRGTTHYMCKTLNSNMKKTYFGTSTSTLQASALPRHFVQDLSRTIWYFAWGENAGYLSGDRKVGTEWTSVSSFPLIVIQLTVLVFSPSPHYCSALSLSLLWRSVGLPAPGSVCTGLQLPGLFLPLAPSHLSSNSERCLLVTCFSLLFLFE